MGFSRVPIRVHAEEARLRPVEIPVLSGDPTRLEAATRWRPTISLERTLAAVLDEARGRSQSG
jgi:GDP-4-dehydro-6-deoxy-D-mannose reductase